MTDGDPHVAEYDPQPILENVVTHRELAEFLGISELALSHYRDLPVIRLGDARFYFKETVTEWLHGREGRDRPETP